MGELTNAQQAFNYKVILEAAKDTNNQDIIGFCRSFVWPLYKIHMKDAHWDIDKPVQAFWENYHG